MVSEIELREKRKQLDEQVKKIETDMRQVATKEQLAIFDSWSASDKRLFLLRLADNLPINEDSIDESWWIRFEQVQGDISLLSDEEAEYARKKGWVSELMKCTKCGGTIYCIAYDEGEPVHICKRCSIPLPLSPPAK
jgi:hypothetical protein